MEFNEKQLKQIERAKDVLQQDERVLDVTTGMIEVRRLGQSTQRNGAILVTDRRVILYTKKVGGYEMNDHVFGLLTALDYKKGVMFGNLTLAASGDRTHVSQIPKIDVERIAKAIRGQMAAAHQNGVSGGPIAPSVSPADEVRKLAELHRDGIITDVEFETKKKQLLGL
ncbi:MAG TPA: PH domain-containing protein [Pseudonocardiaceae bacterium]|nr:PH domain-containing protein [Pseudonocardiaceae bacterium]